MNHSGNTNLGGWQGSDLRYDVLGSVDVNDTQNASITTAINPVPNTLMSALPIDLRVVMRPITKYTDNHGGIDNDPTKVTATIDFLPLLSEYEIFGARTYANIGEQAYQQQYDYYRAGNSKSKAKANDTTVVARWWNRSIGCDITDCFCTVVSNIGSSFRNYAYKLYGLSPSFLV